MPKARLFWPLLLSVFLTDCATKIAAVSHLVPYRSVPVVGEVVQFTLAYNPGAAMGLTLGAGTESRVVLTLVPALALLVLLTLYRRAPATHYQLVIGLALLAGGAAGNLWDRLRGSPGVVDFIDVGFGNWRFWTFNLADASITTGAVLLAWYYSRALREREARQTLGTTGSGDIAGD